MAGFILSPEVTFTIAMGLTEPEARALKALAGYNLDDFLKVFYEKLGRSYLEPYEDGLDSLFRSVRKTIPGQLARIDRAREALDGFAAPEGAKL